MRRAGGLLPLAVAVAAALPGTASAHAGHTAPVATSNLARLSSVPHGLEAKVVDGDQRLWLRVPPVRTVVVIGLRGEPYLRFSARGIEANVRSSTYFLNQARPRLVPRGVGPRTPPVWKAVSRGHSTSWHEDRLHALALAAHPAGTRDLGRWAVPLIVDGKPTSIEGVLRQGAGPSWLWLWPLVLLFACLPGLLRLGDAGLEVAAGHVLLGLGLGAATVGRLGRELLGRPSVSAGQWALVGLTCAVATALVALWVRREWRKVVGLAVSLLALYQGLVLVGTLRHAYVLAAIPAWAERLAASLSLAAGSALLVVTLTAPVAARGRTTREPGRETASAAGATGRAAADQQA